MYDLVLTQIQLKHYSQINHFRIMDPVSLGGMYAVAGGGGGVTC